MNHPPIPVLYGIAQLTIGGAERQLFELIKHLDRAKYRPLVFTVIEGGYYEEQLRQLDVPVYTFTRRGGYDLSPVWKTAALMRREGVQILHTYGYYAGLYGRLATYLKRPPLVISSERATRAWMKHLHNPAYFAIDRLLAWKTDLFIANAQAVKAFAVDEKKMPAARMRVVYNGIDGRRFENISLESVRQARSNAGIPEHSPVIGIVARLDPMKDHQTFLQAASQVVQAHPLAKFLVIGDGPLKAQLETVADDLDIAQNILFVGAQRGRDLVHHMAAADIIVSSSKEGEGCSNSILEAMFLGKPVIATDVGGNAELVQHNETGLVIPKENAETLAQQICFLLENPERRDQLGRRAKKRAAACFSVQRMVDETVQLYEKWLATKPSK